MYAVSQNCSSFCFVRFFIFLPRVVPATEPNELMSTTMVLREEPPMVLVIATRYWTFPTAEIAIIFQQSGGITCGRGFIASKGKKAMKESRRYCKRKWIRWSDWKSALSRDIITILMRFTLAKQCHLYGGVMRRVTWPISRTALSQTASDIYQSFNNEFVCYESIIYTN